MSLPFRKMHGLGNDFVVLDGRRQPVRPDARRVRAIADRRTGVGCDQLVVVAPPQSTARADVFMAMFNANGDAVGTCGNATRCVAWMLMEETGRETVVVETDAGRLTCHRAGHRRVTVEMGRPSFQWKRIPLRESANTLDLPLDLTGFPRPVAVNMGNPHAVFLVSDPESVDLASVGPQVENDPLFPEGTNVEMVGVLGREHLRMRVWERGTGITRACGSGACAAAVAAARLGHTGRGVVVDLDGGPLEITWGNNDQVTMTGPVASPFTGTLDNSLWG